MVLIVVMQKVVFVVSGACGGSGDAVVGHGDVSGDEIGCFGGGCHGSGADCGDGDGSWQWC